MESKWILRKRRCVRVARRSNESEDLFNKLPKELHIDIVKRLTEKDLSIAMCVSMEWRNLILHSCVPTTQSLTVPYLGLLKEMEKQGKGKINPTWLTVVINSITPYPFLDTNHLFNWCSKVMCCKVKPESLIGSCNGLILFCHNNGKAKGFTHGSYHYYVINPVTKQCVAVLKPSSCNAPYSYAALAYDPLESWFFKIVRFQGSRNLNVFSSETGLWTTLSFQLPQKVTKSKWQKKSVYSKGAIYRLSSSRQVIKFHVDLQESVEKQAVAIDLPCMDDNDYRHNKDISVRGSDVLFIMTVGQNLKVWELVESFTGAGCSFEWILTHTIDNGFLKEFNNYGKFLGFHPYYGVMFFKLDNILYYFFSSYNTMGVRAIAHDTCLYRYLNISGFPFLECPIPYACCLEKEVIVSKY
ncbi:uncharacterized protein LOC113855674 [Abrus precatorius]|uniref:Uncharacterized protein LOC113855674 n=1 Tax=Abrus precatorius TaxID=3816 RepID=A0A8B8KJR4_ABRPR|nr:uncharacterized protein LOC113855674 [Abrus precatorius]